MWIRVNQQYSQRDEYAQRLESNLEMQSQTAVPPCALQLAVPQAVSSLPNFADGWVTVQDVHAQWAALLLNAQNDELILDACAAPGGKTTHILELAPKARVIALDIEENRLIRVKENLQRLGQTAEVICGDASQPNEWIDENQLFDRILLDAPCSATGVIRRHPDIKWLRQEADITELVALQAKILTALWKKLKPNGVLLYATCSILPEENSEQIKQFVHNTPDAELIEMDFNGEKVMEKQFVPAANGGDGFFYAKLIKRVNSI